MQHGERDGDSNLQVPKQTKDSSKEPESPAEAQKKLVEELKVEWKTMWSDRFNDRERAEGVSADDYKTLQVEKGTVIHATRDFKALNFKEILEDHKVQNPDRFIAPDVNVGGWNKFVKTNIDTHSKKRSQVIQESLAPKKEAQQSKKSGRGWLHKA
jgi:hypothetical protein